MPRLAAGLLMFRRREGLEVLLVHPGGPFWARRDHGAWSIPKGLCADGEDPLLAAQREFREETGFEPRPPWLPLGVVRAASGKDLAAWAFAGDCAPADLRSNTFTLEWPPRSGRQQSFPEVDRAQWASLAAARTLLVAGQRPLLDRLVQVLTALPEPDA